MTAHYTDAEKAAAKLLQGECQVQFCREASNSRVVAITPDGSAKSVPGCQRHLDATVLAFRDGRLRDFSHLVVIYATGEVEVHTLRAECPKCGRSDWCTKPNGKRRWRGHVSRVVVTRLADDEVQR